ncbi:MAG TPA: leucine-rich repeat domain-containing protein, partial [Chthonomonadaceae bacterium]|nr:leucine-rich repeat domain-containing protein [Chthonomonadaceae bacterium]
MTLIETLLITVGTAVGKSLLKAWLRDDLSVEAGKSVLDLLAGKTKDVISASRGKRQIEDIAEKIALSLKDIFDEDANDIEDSGKESVALALAAAIERASISATMLVHHDQNPLAVARVILAQSNDLTIGFDESEKALFGRLLEQTCANVIDIADKLPKYQQAAFAEMLNRESTLKDVADQLLEEVRQIKAESRRANRSWVEQRFEENYRAEVARVHDEIRLFGVDAVDSHRRYNLTSAYVSLTVTKMSAQADDAANTHGTDPHYQMRSIQPVERTLASTQRLLVRGPAGSGKTTLLQWIAVRSALNDFPEEMTRWNGTIPIFIRLRDYFDKKLPKISSFPLSTVDETPEGWTDCQLQAGRVILLIDGIDELPESKRTETRTWLQELMERCRDSHCRVIVTSRPHAVSEGWLRELDFTDAEIDAMGEESIQEFIERWHQALCNDIRVKAEWERILGAGERLRLRMEERATLRDLAQTPLLCAMICLLNLRRKERIPEQRVELYDECIEMLLRRDIERGVDLTDYPSFSKRQQRTLLEHIAWWMQRNGYVTASIDRALSHMHSKLALLQNVAQDATAEAVLGLLVDRSGILRSPRVGEIDFTHRTFQEFLAAQAAIDSADIGELIRNARDDQWRETIILAVGLAKAGGEEIIQELIRLGDANKQSRHRLHMLAVSCLETVTEISTLTKAEVETRLQAIVPPKDTVEAADISSAGEMALPYLGKQDGYSQQVSASCVRALGLIGGQASLEKLQEWAVDAPELVVSELLRNAIKYPLIDYAFSVVSKLDRNHYSAVVKWCKTNNNLALIAGLGNMEDLDLSGSHQLKDLSPLAGLSNLRRIDLTGCNHLSDLTPLAQLPSLESVDLARCTSVTSIEPLRELTRLRWLDLQGCTAVTDLSPLENAAQLESLDLRGCTGITDLMPILYLATLKSLNITGCSNVEAIEPVSVLPSLRFVNVGGNVDVDELYYLKDLEELTDLRIEASDKLTSLWPLSQLTGLQYLSIGGCRHIEDLSPLASLVGLCSLQIWMCTGITDITTISCMTHLEGLNIGGCTGIVDLTPLSNLSNLRALDMWSCSNVVDLAPLATLHSLERLDLQDCN